jgi:Glucose / Sorbosone dehydrogenase
MSLRAPLALAALAAILFAPAGTPATERVATGLDQPVFLTAPPGDTTRVFIAELRTGAIRILRLSDRTLLPTPFLTVPGVSQSGEQGLLGLAFDPNYASNGYFYVRYNDTNAYNRVVRYHVSPDPTVADANSATLVLEYFQPSIFHNGGWIGFGPDGYLYLTTGDGTLSGNAQQISGTLLGKVLRIDVHGDDFPLDPGRNYAIPPDNPFMNVDGDDEIWAYGLRNPWRASFDRLTGDLYIGDVGQNSCEEVDVQDAAAAGGANYGWSLREGLIAYDGAKPPGAIDPIFSYPHPGANCGGPDHGPAFVGNVITGGYVYRGPDPSLRGRYFFLDEGNPHLWSLVWDGSDPAAANGTNFTDLTDHSTDPAWAPNAGSFVSIASFGEDAVGNLYALDLDGDVFRLPEPAGAAPAIGLAALVALARARTVQSSNTGRRFSRNARIPS